MSTPFDGTPSVVVLVDQCSCLVISAVYYSHPAGIEGSLAISLVPCKIRHRRRVISSLTPWYSRDFNRCISIHEPSLRGTQTEPSHKRLKWGEFHWILFLCIISLLNSALSRDSVMKYQLWASVLVPSLNRGEKKGKSVGPKSIL